MSDLVGIPEHRFSHNVAQLQNVTLDLVELLFRDQYLSRSDMSRMRNSMVCIVIGNILLLCPFTYNEYQRETEVKQECLGGLYPGL